MAVSANLKVWRVDGDDLTEREFPFLDIVPVTVKLDAEIISGTPTDYSWDFGDGGTSTYKDPTHTFEDYGYQRVVLVISDIFGDTTYTADLFLSKLDFVADQPTGEPPHTVQFTNTSQTPTGIQLSEWVWSFGDSFGATGVANVSHTYTEYGNFNVSLGATFIQL